MNNECEEAVVLKDNMYPTESADNDVINIPNLPATTIDVVKTLAENPEAIRATGELVEKVGDAAPKIIDSAGKNFNPVKIASDTIIKGMELEKERQKTRQIEAMTNPEFVRAVGKYKNIDHALQKSYRERSESLDQLYESLKSNDKDERMIAMNAISKIVSSSALSELDKIENKHHDPTQPLLDF